MKPCKAELSLPVGIQEGQQAAPPQELTAPAAQLKLKKSLETCSTEQKPSGAFLPAASSYYVLKEMERIPHGEGRAPPRHHEG